MSGWTSGRWIVADPADARWPRRASGPEQQVRFELAAPRLSALAAQDPPRLVRGALVDDLRPLLDEAPDGAHVVVLSSWVLAYVPRKRQRRCARCSEGRGGTLGKTCGCRS